ncbi:MAG: hypothetical protein WA459_01020 [Stellaceae bacterium]
MWDCLKKTDIAQAQQDLKLRRREILVRQAEESQSLDAERAELETLNQLIDIFTQKFPASVVVAREPVAAPVAKQNIADKPAPAAGNHHQRGYHVNNFAVYTRAMARA